MSSDCNCCSWLWAIVVIVGLYGLKWASYPYTNWKRNKRDSSKERIIVKTKSGTQTYADYVQQSKRNKLDYSLVIPAYNEEKRIGKMLDQTLTFLEATQGKYNYEIIVINDASKDKTTEVALGYQTFKGRNINLKVIEYEINKGKGGAVRIGMLTAIGDLVLMLDADGATEFQEFDKLVKIMKDNLEKNVFKSGLGIVVGSRNHLQQEVIKQRKWYRNILMHVANFIVTGVCGVKLRDTQCGFKLFTNSCVPLLFNTMHIERWAFDVELFIIANYHGIGYVEVPVNWRDVEGSHLSVVDASLTMARDFVMMRIFYVLGLWKTDDIYKLPVN